MLELYFLGDSFNSRTLVNFNLLTLREGDLAGE